MQRCQCAAHTQSVKCHLDGQITKNKGVKREAYLVGGLLKCSLQHKKQKIQQSAEAKGESFDSARVVSQLEAIDSQARCSDRLMQLSLDLFFSVPVGMRKGDKGEQEDEESDADVSADRAKDTPLIEDQTQGELHSAVESEEVKESEESNEITEIDVVTEIAEIKAVKEIEEVSNGKEVITTHQEDDSLVLNEISKAYISKNDLGVTEETDRVSEWIMDLLDDAPMKTIDQLEELAMESLQFA